MRVRDLIEDLRGVDPDNIVEVDGFDIDGVASFGTSTTFVFPFGVPDMGECKRCWE